MKVLASTVFLCLCFFAVLAWSMSGDNTYVFAVSACPPWKTKLLEKYAKDIRHACRNDIEIFTRAAMKAFDVPPENIFTLVNQQATYQGLKNGIRQFANHVKEDSRVILLFNFHGDLTGSVPDDTAGG